MKIDENLSIMTPKNYITRFRLIVFVSLMVIILVYFASGFILSVIGGFLIQDDKPVRSDAIVVLNTGVEYYYRLIEAADLYNKGYADKIIINGNRKMDIERELEAKGFEPCCAWYENSLRVLALFGVPREKVIPIDAEDVYDSIGEAETIGSRLKQRELKKIIITTSKYHTRRAGYIWKKLYENDFIIHTVPAETDPYDPEEWWRDGRQIRWVLAEYGAWIYYFWKNLKEG